MIKLLNSQKIFDGRVIKVFRDEISEDGVSLYREVVRHGGGACVLAEKDGAFAFVRQYRHPVGEYMLELPAGKREGNEDFEVTARRELEEECALKAKELKKITVFAVSPGYDDELIGVFYANKFENSKQKLDDDEILTFEWIEKQKAFEMAENGEITDGKTLLALWWYKANLAL